MGYATVDEGLADLCDSITEVVKLILKKKFHKYSMLSLHGTFTYQEIVDIIDKISYDSWSEDGVRTPLS